MYDARPTGGQSNNEGHGGDKGQKGKPAKQKAIVDGIAHYSVLCLKSNDIQLMQITRTETERRGL